MVNPGWLVFAPFLLLASAVGAATIERTEPVPPLRAERVREGRAVLLGEPGLLQDTTTALRELRALADGVAARPGWQLIAQFDLEAGAGRWLARALCPAGDLWIVRGPHRHCTAEREQLRAATAETSALRDAPWTPGPRSVRLGPAHTGWPAVELILHTSDPLLLSELLEEVLGAGSPFVYAPQARQQRPWLTHFERLLRRAVPAFCPGDATARRWIHDTDFARSLARRHSYMRAEEYRNKRRWERELARIGRYLSLRAGRPVALHETVLCVASLEAAAPWALFDAGLLLDIEVYEAQAVQRDPHGVLTIPALTARQRLLAVAFARQLDGLLLQVPRPGSAAPVDEVVRRALGGWLPPVHAAALSLETLGESADTREALERALELLQPRRADQPVFPRLLVERATPALLPRAVHLYCELSGGDCATSSPNLVSPRSQWGGPIQQRLPERYLAQGTRADLLLLGGYAANRFYALYDLAPALIDGGRLDVVAPLLFWGALIHFAQQRADLASIEAVGYHVLLDQSVTVRTQPPLLKSYHYWSAALIACHLADAGVALDAAVRTGAAIGRHYRRWMTPLYLSYQAFHDGDLGLVADDSAATSELHQRGAALGYKICQGDRTP